MSHGLTGPAVVDAGVFLTRLVKVDPVAVVRLRSAGPDRLALWARVPWGVLVTRTVPGTAPGDVTVSARALLGNLAAGQLALPPRMDAAWRWPLPGTPTVVERLPADHIRALGEAAERAVRAALSGGRGGVRLAERVVRDALLDHVAVVVHAAGPAYADSHAADLAVDPQMAGPAGGPHAADPSADPRAAGPAAAPQVADPGAGSTAGSIEIPQRLVQAVVRMGFVRRTRSDDEPTVRVLHAGRFVGLSGEYGIAWYRPHDELTMKPITRKDEQG